MFFPPLLCSHVARRRRLHHPGISPHETPQPVTAQLKIKEKHVTSDSLCGGETQGSCGFIFWCNVLFEGFFPCDNFIQFIHINIKSIYTLPVKSLNTPFKFNVFSLSIDIAVSH